MNSEFFSDFRALIAELWQHRPLIVVVLCLGLIGFTLLVIDAHCYRKRKKDRDKRQH
jgi:hypothetical protein